MLQYDKLQLLAVLGEPIETGEFGHNEEYVVREGNLTLRLGLNADTSDVSVQLLVAGRDSAPFSATYLGAAAVRVVPAVEGSYMEIAAPDQSVHDLPWEAGLRIRLQPISVELICG